MPDTDKLPSNWGRWGAEDERGTLNLITAEVRARAAAEARTGRTVSLARPVSARPLVAGPGAPASAASDAMQQVMMFTGSPAIAMAEMLIITTHHHQLTHLDALTHTITDGLVYPGCPVAERATAAGVSRGSTSIFGDGVLTRGVLLDLAPGGRLPDGHAVTGADLAAAARRGGVTVEPGDAIVVRGGWDAAKAAGRRLPGMTVDAVRWMHDKDVALYAGDIGDAHPGVDPDIRSPLHTVGLARLGLPLVDGAEPTELAAACAELGRHSFLFVAAPQRLDGATGLPVNPLAVF